MLYTLASPLGLSGESPCNDERALVMRADRRHARHRSGEHLSCPSVGSKGTDRGPLASRLLSIDKERGVSLPSTLARRLVSKFWRTEVRSFAATSKLTRFRSVGIYRAAFLGSVVKEDASSRRDHGGPSEQTAPEGEGEEGAFWRTESQGLCTCSSRQSGKAGCALARCMHHGLCLQELY